MKKTYSIAAARANLPELVKAAERGQAVTLERRGTPVAVVLSLGEYARLANPAETLESAWAAFRRRRGGEGVELGEREVAHWRSKSAGRAVELP